MTHFTVALIIPPDVRDIDDFVTSQMAPYDEALRVAPYVAYSVEQAAKEIQESLHWLESVVAREAQTCNVEKCRSEIERLRQTTPEQHYRERLSHYETFNDAGEPISTYNPNSKWDWYVVGGRWAGWITDRKDCGERLADNIATTESAIARRKIPHAIVTPDGCWHERGRMGWFGMLLTEDENWDDEALWLYGRYPGHQVLIIDAHI